jgi:hypothetical protein
MSAPVLVQMDPDGLLLPFIPLSEDLMDKDIDMMLNRRSCMVATLQIIQSDIPEVRP